MAHLAMGGITYGLAPSAMVRAEDYTFRDDGTRAAVKFPAGRLELDSRLLGKPNLYNILAAVAAALTLNIPAPAVKEGIRSLQGVPGRFEKIDNSRGLHIFVDYAHTDDALRNLLETARELSRGRVILVFGAGGDRDRSKRPRMGKAAGALADWSIITSDNPRSEDPLEIIRDIKAGIESGTFSGWDDVKLPTVKALLRRGFQGKTFLEFAQVGNLDSAVIEYKNQVKTILGFFLS